MKIANPNPSLREIQVIEMLSRGFDYRQTAFELSIADATVRNHVANAFRKLNVRTQAHAYRRLLEHGELEVNLEKEA